jgi:hypothetical protein
MTITKKIDFELEVIDGFPPISIERLNAKPWGDKYFEIQNTPFFVPETAYGDIVAVAQSGEGRLVFDGCVKPSTYKAISIIILDAEMDRQLMDDLRGRDCVVEYGEFGVYRVLAVGVPSSSDYVAIRALLDGHKAKGKISFAELVA